MSWSLRVVEPWEIFPPAFVLVESDLLAGRFLGFLKLFEESASDGLLVVELEDTQVGKDLALFLVCIDTASDCALEVEVLEHIRLFGDGGDAFSADLLYIIVVNLVLKTVLDETCVEKRITLSVRDADVTCLLVAILTLA